MPVSTLGLHKHSYVMKAERGAAVCIHWRLWHLWPHLQLWVCWLCWALLQWKGLLWWGPSLRLLVHLW